MSRTPATRRRLFWPAGVTAVVVAGGAVALATHRPGVTPASATTSKTGAAVTTTTAPPTPLSLVSSTPATGVKSAPAETTISLDFSTPIAKSSPMPRLSPAIAGTWSGSGTATLTFHPAQRLTPYDAVTVTLPSGTSGLTSAQGQVLTAASAVHFTVAGVSTLRLQQLLAELGYLPVAFDPAGLARTTSTTPGLDTEGTTASTVSLAPAAGSFVWRYSNIPSQLAAAWQPGGWNVATQGAVMAFESDHGLGVDGEPGKLVWAALLQAVASRDATTQPYDYLIVTETEPETLYVWRDGTVIYTTLANTGVPGAATALGTFPVYLRYRTTTMSGYNPDGSHYVDPGIPYVAYFNGSDAVHGFIRASYGFPQSDGCVELPIPNAASVWSMDPYGTLVTVTTGALSSELGVVSAPDGGAPTTTTPTNVAPPTTTTTAPPPTTVPPTTSTTTVPATTSTTVPPTTSTAATTTVPATTSTTVPPTTSTAATTTTT